MVLLVPCTDWFVTFTHLGQGIARLAVAVVPVQLWVQLGLLPVHLWLFLGPGLVAVAAGPFLRAFVGLIAAFFGIVALTRRCARTCTPGAGWRR
jgi:ACR3 family arsenite efflux pump ArsB